MVARLARVWNGTEWEEISGPAVQGAAGVPIGTIVAYPGPTAPDGWLLCDGRSTAGTTLAGMLSVTPDLRSRFVLGANPDVPSHVVGYAGGSAKITTSNMPAHSHGISTTAPAAPEDWPNKISRTGGSGATTPDATTTSNAGGGTDYWPPYYALTYIIAAEPWAGASGYMTQTEADARYALKSAAPKSAAGSAFYTVGTTSQRVTFPAGLFSAAPMIVGTPTATGNVSMYCAMNNVTKDGADIHIYGVGGAWTSGNVSVYWLAQEQS